MDQATITALLNFLAKLDSAMLIRLLFLMFGTPFGGMIVVLLLFWMNDRRYRDLIDEYGKDVKRLGLLYEKNVELVKAYQKVSEDLQDTVILSTQTNQRAIDLIQTNQYCPMARLPK